jgi:hypothetical protein
MNFASPTRELLQRPISLIPGITLNSRTRRFSLRPTRCSSPSPHSQKAPAMSPATAHGCSETVTDFDSLTRIRPTPEQNVALKKVRESLRLLRIVLERVPHHFSPYKTEPSYKLTYYTEKLECGHTTLYFPQCGAPTKRRNCPTCALKASLPGKKPSGSVHSATETEVISRESQLG